MLSIVLQAANGAAEGAAGGRGLMSFLPFILIIVVLWFLMIMPQRKRQKETKKMLDELQPKDKVVTIGGIIGTVVKVKDDSIVLKLGKETEMEVRKNAVASKLTKSGEEEKPAAKK